MTDPQQRWKLTTVDGRTFIFEGGWPPPVPDGLAGMPPGSMWMVWTVCAGDVLVNLAHVVSADPLGVR